MSLEPRPPPGHTAPEHTATQHTADLPAEVRLPPHRSVLRYGADGRLLGLDPAVALSVEGLPGALVEMLDELTAPVRVEVLLDRAVRRGARREAAVWLLRELLRAGAVVDAAVTARQVRHRAGCAVVVEGGGPLAVGVLLGLLQSGVGAVYARTAGTVRAADLGTGYDDADRGRERAAALRDAAARLRPGADAPPPPARLVPDLVVLADALTPDPVRLHALHVDGRPHLPVRLRDGIGLVGPLVVPGRTACLGCLERHRRDRAAGWPTVSAQLIGRPGRADPATTAATAALGAAQALAALDSTSSGGARPPTWEVTVELDAAAGTIAHRRWSPHADCRCGATAIPAQPFGGLHHDDATSERCGGRETIMV